MTEDEVLPIEEERPEIPPRPRRWWMVGLALMLAGALLATFIPGLFPRERTGSGTGFAIAADGYVLTAAHVVRGAAEITVHWGRRGHRASAIALSTDHDLALLRVEEGPPLASLVLAADRPGFGDEVTAVGYPAGAARPLALSTRVAGVGWWAVGPEGAVLRDLIATQSPFRPGYSGSPLVDRSGHVVGIVAGNVTGESGQELGFAVSIERAVAWLAGRGMTLPRAGEPLVPLSEAESVDLVRASVVRVEARFPPGSE